MNEPANSSKHLPAIDSSTLELWADTFAKRVIAYVEMRQLHGCVLLPQTLSDGEPHPHAGCPYSKDDFVADSYIGDLPWNEAEGDIVESLLIKNEPYITACRTLGIKP